MLAWQEAMRVRSLRAHIERSGWHLQAFFWTTRGLSQSFATSVSAFHMRYKLLRMTELGQARMMEGQKLQRTWYDWSARQGSFHPAQKLLIILPTVECKLRAKWQDPFEVQRKFGSTTYGLSTLVGSYGKCVRPLIKRSDPHFPRLHAEISLNTIQTPKPW